MLTTAFLFSDTRTTGGSPFRVALTVVLQNLSWRILACLHYETVFDYTGRGGAPVGVGAPTTDVGRRQTSNGASGGSCLSRSGVAARDDIEPAWKAERGSAERAFTHGCRGRHLPAAARGRYPPQCVVQRRAWPTRAVIAAAVVSNGSTQTQLGGQRPRRYASPTTQPAVTSPPTQPPHSRPTPRARRPRWRSAKTPPAPPRTTPHLSLHPPTHPPAPFLAHTTITPCRAPTDAGDPPAQPPFRGRGPGRRHRRSPIAAGGNGSAKRGWGGGGGGSQRALTPATSAAPRGRQRWAWREGGCGRWRRASRSAAGTRAPSHAVARRAAWPGDSSRPPLPPTPAQKWRP